MGKINLFFSELTRRNWGAPWHFFIVVTCTVCYIKFLGVTTMECWQMQIYTAVVFVVMVVYEGWQLRKGRGDTPLNPPLPGGNKKPLRDCVEDMVMNGLGYFIGILPII